MIIPKITLSRIKRIIVFVFNLEKDIIRLDENIFNAKLQGPAPNLEINKNVIPFFATYYPIIDNKSLMQTVKNKFENIKNEHPKSETTNNFYRELASSGSISNFKNIRKPGT